MTKFAPAAELEVCGFQNRYRRPGFGAPLAAATKPLDLEDPVRDFVGPNVRIPVTLLLELVDPRQQLTAEKLAGELKRYAITDERTTDLAGQSVPLEHEPTAALALGLAQSQPWRQELKLFLGQMLAIDAGPVFGGIEPHRRWTYSHRVRPRNRVELRRLGKHDQRLVQRDGDSPELRLLGVSL